MGKILRKMQSYVKSIGASEHDSKHERIRKSTFVLIGFLKTIGCVVWAAMYYSIGLPIDALFPTAFGVIILISIFIYARTANFTLSTNMTLLFMLIIPVLLQWHLGGFASSGVVMMWSFLAPLGALVFKGSRLAKKWFVSFLVLLSVSIGIEFILPVIPPRPFWILGLFLIMNIGVVTVIVFSTLVYFVNQTNIGHQKIESLLLNILPASIVKRMEAGEQMIADHADEVTVLFSDIVGFTRLSEKLNVQELVKLLNSIFSEFDRLAEHYKLEKIKTIGDAYMVVGGLTDKAQIHHCSLIAKMAIDMQAFISRLGKETSSDIEIRIGIHTGPVVAGVIGTNKFSYDVWGDTVNTASRMESHGKAGSIHISETAYNKLKDEFICIERGSMDIKGKGLMTTYFLSGPRK